VAIIDAGMSGDDRDTHAAGRVEASIEAICLRGCRSVQDDIARLARGEVFPEVASLLPAERARVLAELRAIMAVYGGVCPTPPADAAAEAPCQPLPP
jgi:hypothetical protein